MRAQTNLTWDKMFCCSQISMTLFSGNDKAAAFKIFPETLRENQKPLTTFYGWKSVKTKGSLVSRHMHVRYKTNVKLFGFKI